jgi:phosphoribosylcarboxyaminoimidazole (NCAIR) mutase
MRDPRNWVRPVAALAIGTAAGAGLLVLRMRHQSRRQRSVHLAAEEVRRLIRR